MQAEKEYLETDAGPRRHAGPDRLCIATRSVRPVDDLIRFVAGPDGLVPDLKRKLPGRGVWVTARRQTVVDAVRRGAFKRSLKSDVAVPADLPDMVERLMRRAALDALAIAQKAGEVVSGLPRPKQRSRKGESWPCCMPAKQARTGLQKLTARYKAPPRRRSGEFTADTLFYVGGFGFGIGPGKCGTCSPAGRPRRRNFPDAVAGA